VSPRRGTRPTSPCRPGRLTRRWSLDIFSVGFTGHELSGGRLAAGGWPPPILPKGDLTVARQLHCRDLIIASASPAGTADLITHRLPFPSHVSKGTWPKGGLDNFLGVVETQPSLRDSIFSNLVPALKGWAIVESPSRRWRTDRPNVRRKRHQEMSKLQSQAGRLRYESVHGEPRRHFLRAWRPVAATVSPSGEKDARQI